MGLNNALEYQRRIRNLEKAVMLLGYMLSGDLPEDEVKTGADKMVGELMFSIQGGGGDPAEVSPPFENIPT